ncbi:MAG: DEAD/DEAH box helicase [Symploca sp. SIO2E9]|nr:DEAD/DEAH box helicase [Symploca sp. SIO2E9]
MTQLAKKVKSNSHSTEYFELRDYQKQVVKEVYDFFRIGKKSCLIYGPTGSGKTAIASKIIADAVSKGRRVLFGCHRQKLISQTQETLLKFFGISCGIIWKDCPTDYSQPVQLGMIQTIQNRELPPEIGLVIFDECHSSIYYSISRQIMAHYSGGIFALSKCFFVGLSATPWRTKPKEGFCQFFDCMVRAPYPKDLIAMGHLCRPRHFGYHGLIDFSKLELSGGDYTLSSMRKALKEEYNAEVIEKFLALCPERKAIAFCGSVEQAENLAELFEASGVTAEVVVGDTQTASREAIYQRFASGETQVISSCMALCEGFDEKSVQAVIVARPTKSLALHLQMNGRGLRVHPQKSDVFLLDFGENFHSRHLGLVTKKFPLSLCSSKSNLPDGESLTKECSKCHAMVHALIKICPHCGYEFEFSFGVKTESSADEIPIFGEILSEQEKAQLSYVRGQMKRKYKAEANPMRVKTLFFKRFGYYAPDEWFVGAIFGGKYPNSSKVQYLQFLKKLRPDAPRPWVEYMMRLEFGYPGRQYQFASGRSYTPPPIETEAAPWWESLNVNPLADWEEVMRAYQQAVKAWSDCSDEIGTDQIRLLNNSLERAKLARGIP